MLGLFYPLPFISLHIFSMRFAHAWVLFGGLEQETCVVLLGEGEVNVVVVVVVIVVIVVPGVLVWLSEVFLCVI